MAGLTLQATASTTRASAAEVTPQAATGEGSISLARPHHRIWAIAGPSIIAGSSEPMVALIDAWAVGHLPSPVYLAAIAVGAGLFSYLFWAFGFLRMGTTGLVAQASGRRDKDELAAILMRAMALGLAIGAAIILLGPLIYRAGLAAYAPPEAVIEPLTTYFDIRLWGAPATLMQYAVTGYFLGRGQARRSLALQLTLNIGNGILNLIFVVGMGMGVAGVALGTLAATFMAVMLGIYFVWRDFSFARLKSAFLARTTWQPAAMSKLFSLSGLLMLRTLILLTSLLMVTRQAAALGESALAASQIMFTFMMLISLGLDGFAFASEALAGEAAGAGDKRAFSFWVRCGFGWSAATALFYGAAFWLAGGFIVEHLTDLASVRQAMQPLLPLVAILPLLGFAAYQFDGIYVALTAAGGMLATMAAAGIIFFAALVPMSDAWGLTGLWGAFALFLALRGVMQALLYPRLAAQVGA